MPPPWASAPISLPSSTREGLIALDRRFLQHVAGQDDALHEQLLTARAVPDGINAHAESQLIVALGPRAGRASWRSCSASSDALDALVARTRQLDPVHACKRLFVQRQAVKKYADPSGFDGAALRARAGSR